MKFNKMTERPNKLRNGLLEKRIRLKFYKVQNKVDKININLLRLLNKRNRKEEIITNRKLQKNKMTSLPQQLELQNKQMSLRGGGCGSSTPVQDLKQIKTILPQKFIIDMKNYLNIILEKAQLASDEFQRQEILIAFQWFNSMREHFNTLCVDSKSAASVFDLIFDLLPKLLQTTVTYLRISGLLALQVLQIGNDLARVLFTFFMTNGQRYLKIKDKESLQELIVDIETQIEIESQNIWVAGLEFEITMIKAVIDSSPSNSDEGKKLLVSFLGGLVQSVLTMSPSNDLIDSLINGAKFLYQANQTNNLKKKYEVYYYFESLKWYLFELLKQGLSPQRVLTILQNGYYKYIQNSNDWLINFCWVKMIASIISYRPMIQKSELDQNPVVRQQIWNQLLKNKIINQLSFDKTMARLLFQEKSSVRNILIEQKLFSNQIYLDELLKSIYYDPKKIFQFKDQSQKYQSKVDYLKTLETDKNQLIKILVQEQEFYSDFEQGFNQQQKNYDSLKKCITEKEKKMLFYQLNESVKDLMEKSFNSIQYINNLCIIIQLFIKKLSTIIESNVFIENKNTIKQEQNDVNEEIQKLENEFNQNIDTFFSEVVQEKNSLIYSLVILEVKLDILQKKKNFSALYDEQIMKAFQNALLSINKIKNLKSIYQKTFKYIEEILLKLRKRYEKFEQQQNTLVPLVNFEIIIVNYLNKNTIQWQNLQNQKYFLAMSSQSNLNRLIENKCLKYILSDQCREINKFKNFINEKANFLENNQNSLIDLVVNKQDSQFIGNEKDQEKLILLKLFQAFQSFLNSEEQEIQGNSLNGKFSTEQLFSLLNSCSEQLKEKQASTSEIEQTNRETVNYSIVLLKQAYIKYLENPEKLNLFKNQIKLIFKNLIDSESQTKSQQLEFKQQLHPQVQYMYQKQINEKLSNFTKSLENMIDHLNIMENLLNEKIEIIENIVQADLAFDKEIDNEVNCFQELTDQLNLKLNEQFTLMIEIKINLTEIFVQPINDELNFKQYGFQLQFILSFLDSLQPSFFFEQSGIFQKGKQIIDNFAQQAKDSFDDQNYKVRQCFVVSLIQIQSSQLEQHIVKFCQDNIVQVWVSEKDERVKGLLKNTEIMEMQKSLFSSDLKSFAKRLQEDIEEKFNKISDLEQRIHLEGNIKIREQMQLELQQEHNDFEDYLDNINDMTQKLEISIQFLKDIKRSLTQLKQKIDCLQETVNNIGDDVRKLRGKTFTELIDLRKDKVLEQKQYRDMNQIYIPLKCQEWDPMTGKQIGTPTILLSDQFSNQEAEINEFIQNDLETKDVLLLRGVAGSGKSRASGKIEEFLWQKYQEKQSTWIPIYVSLPTQKEPKFNLIDQALESEFYQFDKIQIREFKEAIQQNQMKIILILDSYDEMKQDCIQQNLYHTNRFQDLLSNIQDIKVVRQFLKVIITTRTEILTSINYQLWFYGESIESMKEIELLGFDEEQQQKYLEEYVMLNVKREFLETYSFLRNNSSQKVDFMEFLNVWKIIKEYLHHKSQEQSDNIINEAQAKQLSLIIKKEKIYQQVSKDQIVSLEKRLIDLWSPSKFKKLIISSQIQHILTTPFMMEIVVQVLPTMTKKYSDASNFKEKFIKNYQSIKVNQLHSLYLIKKYTSEKRKQQGFLEQIEKEEPIDEKLLNYEANQIWDQLQKDQYFKKFSLVDKIDRGDLINIQEVDIVIQALIIKKLTVFDFYLTFVEYYHNSQIRKQLELGRACNIESLMQDLFNFSQSLALEMTMKQLSQIKYQPKGQLNLKLIKNNNDVTNDWIEDYFNDFQSNGDYKKLIRSCILLNQKGSNHSFTHKSIQEFFVGHFLLTFFQEQEKIQDEDFQLIVNSLKWEKQVILEKQQDLKLKQKQSLNQIEELGKSLIKSLFNHPEFNLSYSHFSGVCPLIREELKQQIGLKEKLIQLVQFSKLSNQFERAASNSIYLLGYQQETLQDQNLKNIQISQTELVGLSFFGSDLEGSVFDNVLISSCNFNNANLRNVNWTNIKCNELPSLIYHDGPISNFTFSPNGTILAVSISGIIYFSIVKEGSQQKIIDYQDIKCERYFGEQYECGFEVREMIFSPNGEFFVIGWQTCLNEDDQENDDSAKSVVQPEREFHKPCTGHEDNISAVAISQDSKILATGSQDKTIRLWKISNSEKLELLEGHESGVQCVKFMPNGRILGSFCKKILILWNLETNKKIRSQKGSFKFIKFFNDNQHFMIFGVTLNIWEVDSGKSLQKAILLDRQTKKSSISFSDDEQILAIQIKKEIQLLDWKNGKILSTFEGQSQTISILKFQPQGLTLAYTKRNENTIQLLDAQIEKSLINQDGHHRSVEKLILSPDGQLLISSSQDKTIRLWEINQGKQIGMLENFSGQCDLQFSLNGDFIFIVARDSSCFWYYKEAKIIKIDKSEYSPILQCSQMILQSINQILAWCVQETQKSSKIKLVNLKNLQKIELQLNGWVKEIQFTQNEEFIIIIFDDKRVQIRNISQEFALIQEISDVKVLFSQDNQLIAFYNVAKKEVVVFNSQDMKQMSKIDVRNLELKKLIMNKQIIALTSTCVLLFDVNSGDLITKMNISFDLSQVYFSPDSQIFVTFTSENQIRVWQLFQQKFAFILEGHKDKITGIVFSQNSLLFASTSKDNLIILWNIKEQQQLSVIHRESNSQNLQFSPNCQILTIHIDKQITLWDVNSGDLLVELNDCQRFDEINSKTFAFSPDNNLIAYLSVEYYLTIWNISQKKEKAKIIAIDSVRKIFFSSDGLMVAFQSTASANILLWDFTNQSLNYLEYQTISEQKFFLSPDSQIVAILSQNNEIDLWNTQSGKFIASLSGHKQNIESVAFSPNCQQMASCGWDQTIIIWDIIKCVQQYQLKGHSHFVKEIVYSPNGLYLVSSSFDQTVRLWDITNGIQSNKQSVQIDYSTQILHKFLYFLPKDQLMLLWRDDLKNTVSICDLRNPDASQVLISEIKIGRIICFSKDQKFFVYRIQDAVMIFDLDQKKEKAKIDQCEKFICFSHNSKLIAFQTEFHSNIIELFHIEYQWKVRLPKQHTERIKDVIFSLNDDYLISGGADGTIRIWNISQLYKIKNLSENSESPQCQRTLAAYSEITAQNSIISNAVIHTKAGWNLKELFLQKGARII